MVWTFPAVRVFFVGVPRSLTVFGRSLLLITLEVAANAICWAIAARSHAILGLAILAWTIGLRHALDADHISAIDNATRTLINHGRLAITCGLFFSLGHSTIVIVVNVAIVISTSIYNKLDGVGNVGSIVGVYHHPADGTIYISTSRDGHQWIFLVHCWSR
jgi:high-affinity nickel-transport protein